MTKAEYLAQPAVREFVNWLTPLLDQPGSFEHKYTQLKPKMAWECKSIYDAYDNYAWGSADITATTAELESYATSLQQSVAAADSAACLEASKRILAWGGVTRSNVANLTAKHEAGELIPFYQRAAVDLHPATADDENIPSHVEMNSGFTKLYAMLLPDFIIYDSRVGAALGLLVRRFCEETTRPTVPTSLAFAFAPARGKEGTLRDNPRNPSTDTHAFPALRHDSVFHTRHNLRANWLLRDILDTQRSKFNDLPAEKQMRALEAALFMIGYRVN